MSEPDRTTIKYRQQMLAWVRRNRVKIGDRVKVLVDTPARLSIGFNDDVISGGTVLTVGVYDHNSHNYMPRYYDKQRELGMLFKPGEWVSITDPDVNKIACSIELGNNGTGWAWLPFEYLLKIEAEE